MPKSEGGRPTKNSSHNDTSFDTKTAVLEDIGISRQTANRYEKIAARPHLCMKRPEEVDWVRAHPEKIDSEPG